MNKEYNAGSPYMPINSDDLEKHMVAIEDCWKMYLSKISSIYSGGNADGGMEYSVNTLALREIVERVYQRRDYFMRYHSGMVMSEFKEIGLNMYWISKFKPFHLISQSNIDALAFDVNDDFAMFYMLNALKNLAEVLHLSFSIDRFSQNLYNEILYCLKFRDLSKESLGILAELVAYALIPEYPCQ